MADPVSASQVLDALRPITDPDFQKSIVELGFIKDLHIGHLMILNQVGSMPHELALENIRRTATEVLPNLRHIWNDNPEYTDNWWPSGALVRDGAGAAV